MRNAGACGIQTNRFHRFIKTVAIFCFVDSIGCCTNHFDIKLFQHTFARQIQSAIQCGLPTHGRQQRIRSFLLDNFRHRAPFHRLDVSGISHGGIRHDRRRIRVDEDDAVALFAQRFAGLCAGVIKLASLTDDDGTRAQNQDGLDVGTLRHFFLLLCGSPPSAQ